jgi:hypothetical protein
METMPPKPKREVADFLLGKTVHWFDGGSDNVMKDPKIIPMTVVSNTIDSKGRLIVFVIPSDKLPESLESIVYAKHLEFDERINWHHQSMGDMRVFVISNPFFLTESEVAWLSKAGKTNDYRNQLIAFMKDVTIGNGGKSALTEYAVVMYNWVRFWHSHKPSK